MAGKRGRPSKEEAEIRGDIADMREQVTLKFFGLSEKVYKHLVASVTAERPCAACWIAEDGTHTPGKAKDADGKCALCHGTYLVPDNQQRNWAATEALPLITQAKPVEMKIDNKTVLPELEAQYKGLPDALIVKLLESLKTPEVVDVQPVNTSEGACDAPGAPAEGDVSQGSYVLDPKLRENGENREEPPGQ